MLTKNIAKWLGGAAALGFAASATAASYSITYTDTAANSLAGIVSGQQATIKLVLDNGNSSVANQTWTAANVQCVTFTFNNAQNLFLAINYSGSPFTSITNGTFTTNAAGVLQTAPTNWSDESDPVTNPFVTNIAGATAVFEWFIDGANEVIDITPGEIDFTNVGNNVVAANWSNPVLDSGACGAAPPPPQVQQPVPTLTESALVMLSSLLVLGAAFFLRRQRQ